MTDIDNKVFAVIGGVFGVEPEELSRDMVADDVDGWDSLSHVTVILMLSQEFGVKISPTETEGIENIGALIDLIKNKIS